MHEPTASQVVVADLRRSVLAGQLKPGSRLDEVSLGTEHNVSRNTLREAFRMLADDGLVVHEPHRGVFVRTVDTTQAHEIYAVRRMVQVGALKDAALLSPGAIEAALPRVRESVEAADRARDRGDWEAVGTLNGDFHQALTAVAGNTIVDRILEQLLTELRLFFLTAGTSADVHERYVDANRRLFELVRAHELGRAAVELEMYLVDAEKHLLPR